MEDEKGGRRGTGAGSAGGQVHSQEMSDGGLIGRQEVATHPLHSSRLSTFWWRTLSTTEDAGASLHG
jgi:hypothetical protein